MTSFLVTKRLGSLRPVDEAGQQALRRMRDGEVAVIEISRPRNVHHHRLFWALLTLVADNSRHYDMPEQVLAALKIALGHVDTIVGHDGKTYFVPKSISFAQMNQDDFAQFFDRCVDVIVRRFLPGVTDEEVRREILAMVGGEMPARCNPEGSGSGHSPDPATQAGKV